MEVCVPKELKWSEQVKKVWTDQYLCGIKPNTWLHSQGCRGWGHHGSSSGTVHGGGLQHHCFQKERQVSWMLGGAWPEMCRDQNSWAVSGFIRESCSSLAYLPMACNSFLKLLLPSHCESRHWLFPVGTRQASLHRQGMVTEPAEMQLGAKGLRNKHKNLSCELKDVKDLILISVPYAPLTLIVLKVLCDFLPFSLHPTPVQVHPCCSHGILSPYSNSTGARVKQISKTLPKDEPPPSCRTWVWVSLGHQEPLTSASHLLSQQKWGSQLQPLLLG